MFGTDVTVRYLPPVRWWRFGTLSLEGFGVRHSISQYFRQLPVELSAQFMWQRLTIEDEASDNRTLSARALAANLAASKSLSILTVYGGIQMEQTRVEVDYVVQTGVPELGSPRIQFARTAQNRYRLIGGINLGIGLIQVNADYALGALNTVTVGMGVAL